MLAPPARAPSLLKRVLDAITPAPPRGRPFSEMGVSGASVYAGYAQQREKSSQWVGAQRYVTITDMAVNTSIIAAGVHYFLNLIAYPSWTMVPADESAEAKKLAEFFDEVLHDMDRPWSRVVRRAGTYRFFGFGVQEWIAKRRPDGRVGLASVEPRPQHTIERWATADSGAVEGVWQRAPQSGALLGIPRSKLVYLVEDALSDSPEGVGIFRHLAEPWERLKVYHELEARAFERDLRGIPVGRVPYSLLNQAIKAGELTQDRADTMVKALEDFVQLQVKQSNTSITLDSLPYYSQAADGAKVAGLPQWGLELLQGTATGVEALGAAITRTQEEMARILTAEHLLMGAGGGTGGNRALSEDKSRNLYLVANAVLTDIAAAATRDLVEPVWLLNSLPDELRPRLEAEDVAFQDAEAVAATLAKMAQAGAVLAPDDPVVEDVRTLLGVSAPSPVPAELLTPSGAVPGDDEVEEDDEEVEDEDTEEGVEKFNPYHDELGRFATAMGAGISSNGAAAALLAKNSDPSVTIDDITAGLSPQERELMEAARASQASGTSTRDQYLRPDGTYTPEREALHEEIIGEMFTPEAVAAAMPEAGVRPELVMTGGRPAAGKTGALRSGGIDAGPPKYIYLSADSIQERLPGFSGARAGLFNPEAQDIADKAEGVARALGVNVVFDATMKTGKSATARVARYHASGYDVSGYFVHTTPEVAARRSVARFVATGRFVPPEISLSSRSNEAVFDALTPKFKRWALFDNNESRPRLVARS